MRVLVVGTGSIGTRHINNLKSLGHEVYAVDLNPENLAKVKPLVLGAFSSLREGLRIKPEAAFICTFSNSHIGPAIECAKAGCQLFIEKPLALNMQHISDLLKIIRTKKLISMVGCNMRFHPGILHLHKLLKTDLFKKCLLAELEFGYYLPFAKPEYRKSYQANKKLGGNLIFDDIHEIDYAVWFFGKPKKVFCTKGMCSGLKMDTEDHVEMIIEFASGVICTIHMDYLQHGYARRCKIVSEEATTVWDFTNQKIGVISRKSKKWQWIPMRVELYYNKMYLDEVRFFMNAIKMRKQPFNSVEQSLVVLKLAMAANKSCVSGEWEIL
jgi:predicted dehydrogenase